MESNESDTPRYSVDNAISETLDLLESQNNSKAINQDAIKTSNEF